MIFLQNFTVLEQQSLLNVGTGGAGGSFSGAAFTQKAGSCAIINYGNAGAQVIFNFNTAPTAVNTAAAPGTRQFYVPAGETLIVATGYLKYFNAITDAGTTSLIFLGGEGS